MKRKCQKCGKEKELNEFVKHNKATCGYIHVCKLCRNKYQRERYKIPKIREALIESAKQWRKDNIEQARARGREYCKRPEYRCKDNVYRKKKRQSIKLEVIQNYGGKCECCGETIMEFLTIDHINNNGGEHMKELGYRTSTQFYAWLKRNNYPKDDLRLLCWNCNSGRVLNNGVCPHKTVT